MTTYWANDPAYHRHSRRAIQFDGEGKIRLWASCFPCAQVVGKYSDGTATLAQQMNCSVDTIEDRARAAVTYRELWRHFRDEPEVQRRLRELRRTLGYSHFTEAGSWLRKDMDPLEVFAQLDASARSGSGVKKMSKYTNGHITLELPVFDLTSTTIYELADRYGRKARIVVLPDDYDKETAQVRV